MVRLAQSINARLFRKTPLTVAQREAAADPNASRYDINTFRQNRAVSEMIAKFYSVQTLFFLQPNAVLAYNTALYRRQPVPLELFGWRTYITPVYAGLKDDSHFIYLGDLFDEWGRENKAIIDEVHYSPAFNEFVAKKISEKINLRWFDRHRASLDKAAATGARREF
jgi:hypothetical protein